MALEVIESVRATWPDVVLKIVDASLALEVAVKYGLTATPAIAINGRLAFRGLPLARALEEQVRKAIHDSDPPCRRVGAQWQRGSV